MVVLTLLFFISFISVLHVGADLSVARDHLNTPEAGAHMCEYMQNILTKFLQLPCITVAAIEVNKSVHTVTNSTFTCLTARRVLTTNVVV